MESTRNAPGPFKPNLLRQVVNHGFAAHTTTSVCLVKHLFFRGATQIFFLNIIIAYRVKEAIMAV